MQAAYRVPWFPIVVAITIVSSTVATQPAQATWPGLGRAIVTAAGNQLGPEIASDGAGGAIVVWHDRRTFAFNIDAQHVLASGEVDAGWPTNGRALLTDSLSQSIVPLGQEFPVIISDGAGGAIIAWPDGRSSANGLDIYAHHVLASGALDSAWPVNGVTVCSTVGRQGDPVMVSDGAGGAFIAWDDGRSGATVNDIDIYAQHVLASGVVDPSWPLNGTAISTAPATQTSPAIVGDGAGGAIIAFSDTRTGNPGADVFAQRVLNSGVVDPAWPVNGRVLSAALGTQSAPKIISDGVHGAIVTWNDTRDGTNDVYAQRVTSAGAIVAGWAANGQAVAIGPSSQVVPTLVSDGASGAIVAWGDDRLGFHNMRVQHLLASGALDAAWPAEGVAMSTAASGETFQVMASDGAGGAIVAWQRSFDIFADHVLASGALDSAYPANGRAVAALPDLQHEPAIVAAGANGAIVTWMDHRNGTDEDIYALQVLEAGTVDVGRGTGPQIVFARPSPNPAHGAVTLRFALPSETHVRLDIYDMSGRRVRELASGAQPAGDHAIAWDLRDERGRAVGAGLYFVRLDVDGRALTQRLVALR